MSDKYTFRKFQYGLSSEDGERFVDDFGAFSTFGQLNQVAAFQLHPQHGPAATWYRDGDTEECDEEPRIRRHKKVKIKPAVIETEPEHEPLVESDCAGFHKIKRILGERIRDGRVEYLVHLVGEPADQAIWANRNQLNAKAIKSINQRPPPRV